MSDARDRLIDGGAELLRFGSTPAPLVTTIAVLDAFLARPDDLLAVMCEAGVLEQVGWYRGDTHRSVNEAMVKTTVAGRLSFIEEGPFAGDVPVYRRTEEGKP